MIECLLDPMRDPERFRTSSLGAPTIRSPLGLSAGRGDLVSEKTRVLYRIEVPTDVPPDQTASLEKAGPRDPIYFDPRRARGAIVTAGGLCPGINNVIRTIVLTLEHQYQVSTVLGFRFGFAGLDPGAGAPEPIALGPEHVTHSHRLGGTLLGTSRGPRDVAVMVDTLVTRGIDMLFTIGGDGTMRAAHAIAEEVQLRGAKIAIIGVPKTIDNDIPFVDETFGFETAVAMARIAIDASHAEALAAANGIGLVKLMGRDAGFIAAYATLASHDVNLCLVPEVPFRLEGPNGLLAYLERRLARRGHAVIVVAEGCGQELMSGSPSDLAPRDPSGNVRFGVGELDIGEHLKAMIVRHFEARKIPVTLKYIDPSYVLRGVPADAMDAVLCTELGRNAVHAAMAGKTDMMLGRLHRVFTHVPLTLVLSGTKRIDPDGALWLAVTESTGQPPLV